MLALESETLVVWASNFLLGRKDIVTALSSRCHQPVASSGPNTHRGLRNGASSHWTDQTIFKNATSVAGERQTTLRGEIQ